MPTTVDDITDILKGGEYCKERMRKCEANAEKAREMGDLLLVAKFEGHLFAWTELLQKYMHESFNQGKTTDDLLKADGITLRKARGRNARSKGADDTPEPRAMGHEPDASGVGVEEHGFLAEAHPALAVAPAPHQLRPPVGEVGDALGEGSAQGADDPESPDPDSC